jgi:hypothetical protein
LGSTFSGQSVTALGQVCSAVKTALVTPAVAVTPTILQPSNQIVAAGRPLHEPLPGHPGDLGAAHEEVFDRHNEYSPGAMQGNGGLVSLTCLLVTIDVCPVFLLFEHEAVAAVASREPGTLVWRRYSASSWRIRSSSALRSSTIFFTRDRSPPDAEVLAPPTLEYSATHDFQIAPDKGNVEIHYIALSLMIPGRVRFKYQLEGYEHGWVDAGSRRTLHATSTRKVPLPRHSLQPLGHSPVAEAFS